MISKIVVMKKPLYAILDKKMHIFVAVLLYKDRDYIYFHYSLIF